MGDRSRNIDGWLLQGDGNGRAFGVNSYYYRGVFYRPSNSVDGWPCVSDTAYGRTSSAELGLDGSRVVPVGASNMPRSWGALACAYFGQPVAA